MWAVEEEGRYKLLGELRNGARDDRVALRETGVAANDAKVATGDGHNRAESSERMKNETAWM
jgi:hypothetical protein